MLRDRNLIGRFLRGSVCEFEIATSNESHPLFRVSHERMDAFGGMWLMSQMLRDDPSPHLGTKARWSGSIESSQYLQVSIRKSLSSNDRGVFQQLLQQSIPLLKDLGIFKFLICLGCDDLTKLSASNLKGNSFVFGIYEANELLSLANAPREDWIADHRRRTALTRTLLERGRIQDIQNDAPYILWSAIGATSKLPWFDARLTGESFRMIPSPRHPNAANVVLWNVGDVHTLALCSGPKSPLATQEDALVETWGNLFE